MAPPKANSANDARMKIAVVGTGFGARVVAPVFAATPGCEVVDVVSARDEAAVRALIQRADVDLVAVHSPPFLHARDARLALDAGKAVLCDKQFALDAQEAAQLLDEAERAGVVHLMNFEFRWQPARLLLRDAIRDGAVGRVEHVQSLHLSAGSRVPLRPYGWLFDAARGGGWVGAWASHAIDGLRWLLGDVDSITAAARRIDVPERPDERGVMRRCTAEDGLTAWLTLHGGVFVSIDSSFACTASMSPRFSVFGSDGVIECVGDERVTLLHADGSRDELRAPSPPDGTDRHHAAMQAFAEVVRDSVTGGVALPDVPTFADGHACDLVLDQLRAAPIV
jgi:predicted dehydrogenase